jgi:hypothetical protein
VYDDGEVVAMEVSRVSRDADVMGSMVEMTSSQGMTGMRSIWRPTRLGMYTYCGEDIVVVAVVVWVGLCQVGLGGRW